MVDIFEVALIKNGYKFNVEKITRKNIIGIRFTQQDVVSSHAN
jgi:hypothetical protein